MLFVSVK